MNIAKKVLIEFAQKADIQFNGDRAWDIQVHDERFYGRVLKGGSLALGESYMDGWWDCDDLNELIYRILKSNIHKETNKRPLVSILGNTFMNLQSKARAPKVAEDHYDLGNDLYEAMLGKGMVYTCAVWDGVDNLDDAQEQKMDLLCKKMKLKKGDHILDIGFGFGGLAKHAAENYGVKVTGITLSKEQKKKAEEVTKGLNVDFKLMDYRDLTGTFDHVVSVEMFEAVGYKNFRTFMQKVHDVLSDDGLFVLQTIGENNTNKLGEPWLDKYIFPNGMLPSVQQIGESIDDLFVLEDWYSFGADYEPTLKAWFENFDAAWPKLKDKYGERFYRMWKYYLETMQGSSRARFIQDWQIVLSKNGVPGGYKRI